MRIGMNHTLPHTSPEEWASTLRSLGCGAAVFPVAGNAPDDVIEAYCEAAKKYDIVIGEIGIWANPISPDPVIREKAIERSLYQLRLAERVGARCCVNYAGAKANNALIVAAAPGSYKAYAEIMVYCNAQAAGKLTFPATVKPTVNLTVNVLSLE